VEEEKLSELEPPSDRFGLGRGKAVRTRASFGQVWWWKRKSCPNQSQLRTGLVVEEEKLSEQGPTLDRFGVERGKAVRTRANFVQLWWWKRKSCPNPSQLRTGLVVEEEKLSELEHTSDRFSGEGEKAVRTMSNFRQV
jgi:hypothetical protein